MATGMNNPFVWLIAGVLLAVIVSAISSIKGRCDNVVVENHCKERRDTCVKNMEDRLAKNELITIERIHSVEEKIDQLMDLVKVIINQGKNNA